MKQELSPLVTTSKQTTASETTPLPTNLPSDTQTGSETNANDGLFGSSSSVFIFVVLVVACLLLLLFVVSVGYCLYKMKKGQGKTTEKNTAGLTKVKTNDPHDDGFDHGHGTDVGATDTTIMYQNKTGE